MYKPFHLIGLELSISVLNVALRGEPTGSCRGFRGDAVAVAKRALKAGETLDGEGGYTVYAKLIPAERSLKLGALPIGLAHHVKLNRDVAAGEFLAAADVVLDENSQAVRIRREMERQTAKAPAQCWRRNSGLQSRSATAAWMRSSSGMVAGSRRPKPHSVATENRSAYFSAVASRCVVPSMPSV